MIQPTSDQPQPWTNWEQSRPWKRAEGWCKRLCLQEWSGSIPLCQPHHPVTGSTGPKVSVALHHSTTSCCPLTPPFHPGLDNSYLPPHLHNQIQGPHSPAPILHLASNRSKWCKEGGLRQSEAQMYAPWNLLQLFINGSQISHWTVFCNKFV